MTEAILVVNAGSSSLKFSAFSLTGRADLSLMVKGQVEGLGTRPRLSARDQGGAVLVDKAYDAAEIADHEGAIAAVAGWLGTMGGGTDVIAAGHRVAHGGAEFTSSVVIDDEVLEKLERLVPLAPLHQPGNLAAIRALKLRRPALRQIACFDTAFHRGHPEIADRFALPDAFYRKGLRRYGFHGLSYEYIAHKLGEVAPEIAAGKVVVAHLGSGASICALRQGRSIDTTMSFSALDGLPMGTRCGALDPGAVIYLIREKVLPVAELENMLYRESGLRALSGISGDTRDLLASGEHTAKFALDYFVYHVCRYLGALVATLEGADAVVFTAGIGENSPEIRERICERLRWLGLRLDGKENRAGSLRITTPDSSVSAWVIRTDEELMIARHTLSIISDATPVAAG